jgi:outer membrane biosynthesis protein TonB
MRYISNVRCVVRVEGQTVTVDPSTHLPEGVAEEELARLLRFNVIREDAPDPDPDPVQTPEPEPEPEPDPEPEPEPLVVKPARKRKALAAGPPPQERSE